MSDEPIILRVDATYPPAVQVGDEVHVGDMVSEAPQPQIPAAPVSGVVKSIRFDPQNHEFVIVILPTE